MRCTNKKQRYTDRDLRAEYRKREKQKAARRFIISLVFLILLLGAAVYVFLLNKQNIMLIKPFDKTDSVFGIEKVSMGNGTASSAASELCVANENILPEDISLTAGTGGLFSEADKEVLYAKDIHEKFYSASITKIMTTLVALKYGNLEEIVTVGEEAKDIEMGSSVCEIKPGDQLSLQQLLYGLMINSGNDAAMTIAKHIAGSTEAFVEMMNQETQEIGATNTHFTNPHGLQDEDHYTTVYDIYLTFHEALKYDVFRDIISKPSYYATFRNAQGEETGIMWESTNHYFINEATPPSGIEVFGGKTGTTDEAGACLCLYSKDKYGDPYISIILKAESKDTLYNEMNELLSKINK